MIEFSQAIRVWAQQTTAALASLKTSLERTRVTNKRQAGRDNGGRKQSRRCWFHWVHWEPMQRWVTAANNESPKRCEHTPVEFLFVIPLKQLVFFFFLSVFKTKRRSMEVKRAAWVQLCSTEVKLEEYQFFNLKNSTQQVCFSLFLLNQRAYF